MIELLSYNDDDDDDDLSSYNGHDILASLL